MTELTLDTIRDNIDDIDEKIIELIAKREALVKEACALKKEHKLNLYSKERERSLLQKHKALAQKYNLKESFLEDIAKRLLRESLSLGDEISFACTGNKGDKIVIVGGNGGMGRLFKKHFEASDYTCAILEKEDWNNAKEILQGARAVVVCVPIDLTVSVIKRLAPLLNKDTVLCDLTSVKTPVVTAMLEYHKGPVVSFHPMFGPDTKGFVKQVVVCVKGRDEIQYRFLVKQIKLWGAYLCEYSAKEHDDAMSIIQALRHFTTYCYGLFLASTKSNLKTILDLSSPIYRLELLMVGRLFAQDPLLYGDIIMSSDKNLELIKGYCQCLQQELLTVANKDTALFIEKFLKARDYFGDYAKTFLKDSGKILEKFKDTW